MKIKNSFDLLKGVKLYIFDLDGTLYFKGEKFNKVDELIYLLRKKNKILRFVTNTDSKSPVNLYNKLRGFDLNINENELITPVVSLTKFIKENINKKFYLMTSLDVQDYIKNIFGNNKNIFFYENVEQAKKEKIDYVVIGDFSDVLNYNFLNEGFRFVYKGAKILALAKFLIFYTKDGACLNTGAFVKMLEIVSKKRAFLLGKPGKYIANVAIDDLKIKKDEVVIIGDDIDVDIALANNICSYSILLQQGHFNELKNNEKEDKLKKLKPTFVFENIENLYLNLEQLL